MFTSITGGMISPTNLIFLILC